MAAALVPIRAVPDDDTLSVREVLARFTGTDLLAASRETSAAYNGIVLAKAVVIVQCRLKILSLAQLAERLGVGKNTMYRWMRGKRMEDRTFHRAILDLALLLDEAQS
jgi:hypothetical protein